MCGIAGFVNTSPPSFDSSSVLRRMTDAIAHRGPDETGSWHDDFASLGHRRLSIIDLATGQQPMTNETGDLWIVYNGEIFNHADLRPPLEQAGHRYHSHCDTETILHAWEQYGQDCVTHFRGMFSFAIWDKTRRLLFCARDRLGIKPFYYFWNGRTFAFASEMKALFEHPAISPALRETALPEYFTFGYGSGEETMFQGIRKLMPGHTLLLDLNHGPQVRRYWDVPDPASASGTQSSLSDREWIAETRRRVEESVRMRLMSDVPLGMFLSGGVDSSAIAAMIKRMTNGPVKTFSVGYAEAPYSELTYAAEVARLIGTDHHEVVIGMGDFFSALPRLIWHEDEPIAWPSSVSLHFVSQLAAREVKVVLTGEGSDEIFAGYSRYGWTRLNLQLLSAYRSLVPSGLRDFFRSRISTTSLLSRDVRRKLGHSFLGREESIESLYVDNFYSPFPAAQRRQLLKGHSAGDYDNFLGYWNSRAGGSLLQRMLYTDQKTYLVELLMKQDQMSMSASIESRVPLLDHTLVEFAMSIPDHLKIHGNTQKHVFKEAVSDLLPRSIVHRKKMGFPTPLRQWLRDERALPLLDSLLEPAGLLASYCDMDAVRRLIGDHRAGSHDYTDRIWSLLNLQIWGDTFITGREQRWQETGRNETGSKEPLGESVATRPA
jgi:asparagine synthase (glutamine-hydrolysing)